MPLAAGPARGYPRRVLRIVVLGVGTQIGKTWVATALARSAERSTCIALKPIETGCDPAAQPADAAALAEAAGHSCVSPHYVFSDPMTPWLAAELAGSTIDLELIPTWVREHTTKRGTAIHATTCIVETAGGVFSPLTEDETNFDLARQLDPALWLLVAPNRLGVLHDVGATLHAMRALNRPPDMLVLNHHAATDASTSSNLSLLQRLHPELPILGVSAAQPPTLSALRTTLRLD